MVSARAAGEAHADSVVVLDDRVAQVQPRARAIDVGAAVAVAGQTRISHRDHRAAAQLM